MASVEEAGQVRLIAVMTPPHRVILHSSRDTPERDVLCALANHLRSASRPIPGVLGPRPLAEAFADVWTKLSGQRTSQGLVMTVYELRQIRDPGNASGTYRRATDTARDLLETWVDAFSTGRFTAAHPGARKWAPSRGASPSATTVSGRTAASRCPMPPGSGRRRRGWPSTPSTPPRLCAARSYATSCVAALCHEILAAGKRFCTLFADVENSTVNDIYQRRGFEPLGEFVELDFE